MAKKNLIQEGTRILSENTVLTKKEEATTLDAVNGGIDAYAADIELIMVDYIADPAMIEEIRERTRLLREAIAKPVSMLQLDRETRCKQLEDYNKEVISLKEQVDECNDIIIDMRKEVNDLQDEVKTLEKEAEELQSQVDKLEEKTHEENDIVISTEGMSMVNMDKIRDFLSSEIFPHFNEQVAKLNF